MAGFDHFSPDGGETLLEVIDAEARKLATSTTAGRVIPDNKTVFVDENGVLSAKGGGGGVPVGDVSGAAISTVKETVSLTWSDPEDVVLDGTPIAVWAGTYVVRKAGSAPTSEEDGYVVANITTRNQHAVEPLVDDGVAYDGTYYYRFFPYTTRDVVTAGTSLVSTPAREVVQIPEATGRIVYDGEEHTATFDNYDPDKMDATLISGTEAAIYVAGFTPKHDYMWPDGSRDSEAVSWRIWPKPITTPTISGSYTYDGTEQTAAISAYDTSEIEQSGEDKGTNAGTYTVTFSLKDKDNTAWAETGLKNDRDVSWSISKAAGGASLSATSVTLDGDHTSVNVTISEASGTVTGVVSSDESVATAMLNAAKTMITISSVGESSGVATVTLSLAESDNYNAAEVEIAVSAEFSRIYGAEWDGTSTTAWSRTDAAVGFVDPVPAVNNGTGSSPFDSLMPWAGMKKVEDATGGVLVEIPKYYYKWTRNGTRMKLQIADGPQEGFLVSPAHADRGDGQGERDVVYVGRYHCATSTYKSTTGVKPANNYTRANFRSYIHNLGTEYWQYDYAMYWTIMMLYLVEFADWNSQAKIGYGCGNNSAAENAGLTDAMQYHTGTNATSRTTYGHTQYRYIEDLWGNVYDWCDGIYFSSANVYCIKNPASFSDTSGGTLVGTRPTSSGYISAWNNPTASGFEYALYPSAVSGSESTYVCDYCGYGSSGVVLRVGGYYYQNQYHGAFYLNGNSAASDKNSNVGSRLQKLPSAA